MKILMILHRLNGAMLPYDESLTHPSQEYILPLGMPYIASYLKRGGYDITIINLNNREGLVKDIVQNELNKADYDMAFVGGTTMFFPHVRHIIQCIREFSPKTKIVAGGGMVSAQPEIMLKMLNPDFIIVYEGEQTALELVKCIESGGNLSGVDGIGYVKNGGITITKPRAPIEDLDSLPYPDFESFGYSKYLNSLKSSYIVFDSFDFPRPYSIISSRSCTFLCTFCFHTVGNKYRERSIENIMGEIKFAVEKYRANIFFFCDELFAHKKERVMNFCKAFIEFTKTVPYPICINVSLRVDCADEEMIAALKEAGCRVIGLGLESYSQSVLTSMKKHVTPQQIKDTLTLLAKYKMVAQGSFIFGDTAETIESAKETLEFFENNQDIIKDGAYLGFIIPFQGTADYKYCLKKGIIKDEIDFIEHRAKYGYELDAPLNMTSMNKKDFEWLKERISESAYLSKKYSFAQEAKSIGGENRITTICPYCQKTINIKNAAHLPHGVVQGVEVGCRECSGRFIVVPRLYPIAKFFIKVMGFTRIRKVRNAVKKIIGM